MEEIEVLEVLVAEAKIEAKSFYENKNATAGTRLRMKMLSIKDVCQEIRVNVSEIKNEK